MPMHFIGIDCMRLSNGTRLWTMFAVLCSHADRELRTLCMGQVLTTRVIEYAQGSRGACVEKPVLCEGRQNLFIRFEA